jgi:hypothetical protein
VRPLYAYESVDAVVSDGLRILEEEIEEILESYAELAQMPVVMH